MARYTRNIDDNDYHFLSINDIFHTILKELQTVRHLKANSLFIKKAFSVFMALALLITLLPNAVQQSFAAEADIPEGSYPIVFRLVKDNENSTSVANSFFRHETARLVISNGNASLEVEVTSLVDSVFPFIGTRQPDKPKATTSWGSVGYIVTSGEDGYTNRTSTPSSNPGYVVYSIPLFNVWAKQHDLLMFINDPGGALGAGTYVNWYNVQLELDLEGLELPKPSEGNENNYEGVSITKEVFDNRLAEGYTIYNNAEEGQSNGNYPNGSRAQLYTKLQVGEALGSSAGNDQEQLKAAYIVVDKAIKEFEAQIVVVNKSRLQNWVSAANLWLVDAKNKGETETGAPSNSAAVYAGEYPVANLTDVNEDGWSISYVGGAPFQVTGGNISGNANRNVPGVGFEFQVFNDWHVTGALEKAQALINDPLATQLQVNSLAFELASQYDFPELSKQQFVEQPIKLLLLDSFNQDAALSPYAADINENAVLLQQAAHPNYQGYLNISFLTEETMTSIGSPTPNINGAYNVNSTTGVPSFTNRTSKVTKHADANGNTFQIPVRAQNSSTPQTDDIWKGYTVVRYGPDNRIVYVSLNGAQLDELNSKIAAVQAIHDNAVEGTGNGEYPEFALQRLQDAIDEAKETGDKLSASRPEILAAADKLQRALDSFAAAKSAHVYYSVVHATDAAYSSMHSYMNQPATIASLEQGGYQVTLTINDSLVVPEFRVSSQGELVDSTIVSVDEAANTRTVSFLVDGLDGLVDAEVRNVVAAQNYDRVHKIRLNFSSSQVASELGDLVIAANSFQRTATTGTEEGQYSAEAKSALISAISAAQVVAAEVPVASDTSALYTNLESAFLALKNSQVVKGPGTPGNGNEASTGKYPEPGKYYLNFQVLKNGENSKSMAQDYVNTQALVEVSGTTKTVKFLVKQSKEITYWKINGLSETIVSTNTENNTRITSFVLSTLTGKINGEVRIDWDNPATNFSYHNTYTVQFLFDESSAVKVADNATVPGSGTSGNIGVDPGKVDDYNGNGSNPGKEEESDAESGTDDSQPNEGSEVDGGTDQENSESSNGGNGEQAPAVIFSDTATHWAKASIDRAVELGIVNGFSDGSFRPDKIVTRAEFAVMISRALGLQGEGDASKLRDFTSVPDWAQTHVARTVAAGLIGGFEDATFRSNGQLTRSQLAVIMVRAAGLPLDSSASLSFTDKDVIPAWAQKEVAAAVEAGLIQGKNGNRFDPLATATRAEALTLIIRLLEQI